MAINYDKVLTKYPKLSFLLNKIVASFLIEPISSIMIMGGITLGDFSPEMSDIDIVMISEKPITKELRINFDKKFEDILILEYGEKVDIKIIEKNNISSESPLAIHLDNSKYKLHSFDMILLKKYSIILHGQDYRNLMKDYIEQKEVVETINHVIKNMLPRAIEQIKKNPNNETIYNFVLPYTFVMSRCIYTLFNNKLTFKTNSAKWINNNLNEFPFLNHLGALSNEFSIYYKNGKPKSINIKILNETFIKAIASFLCGVLYFHNIKVEPEVFIDEQDMVKNYYKLLN